MGDCVDCSLCVQVCPTGIDIRDGLQYMCIGCGACVDACNQVMDKMHYESGLIRYTSGRAIEERLTQPQVRKRMFRPRIIIYMTLLGLIAAAFLYSLATRTTLRMDIIRDRGVLGREVAGGMIENVYRLQMMNASEQGVTLVLGVDGAQGLSIVTAQNEEKIIHLDPSSNALVPVVVRVPAGELQPGLHDIHLSVASDDPQSGVSVTETTRFYVPQ